VLKKYLLQVEMELIILSLIVALFWAINPIITKYILTHVSYPFVLVLTNIIFFICIIIFGYFHLETIKSDWAKISNKQIGLMLSNTVLFGFIAGILYMYLLKRYDANIVIGLTYMSPIFIVFLSQYFLKEKITHISKLGIIFIVLGGIMIAQSNSKH
jgi:drug/metabolite transporter (DMT)-like permease